MTNNASILIIDDDKNMRFALRETLRDEVQLIHTAKSGEEALEKIGNFRYDLLLIDLDLGGFNGLEILESARQIDKDVVAIILTGNSSEKSAILALRLGAFDYSIKPEAPEVLRHRVREGLKKREIVLQQNKLLRSVSHLRKAMENMEEVLEEGIIQPSEGRFQKSGPLKLDLFQRSARINGRALDLTTAEFDILVCLVQASPRTISPRDLLNEAMNYDSSEVDAKDIIKWHIHNLRKKLEPSAKKSTFIKTVRYKGYMWTGN